MQTIRGLIAVEARVCLRRFRAETLRRARVPKDLLRFWLGHAAASVTDKYAQGLSEDETWRREWCDRADLDFCLVGLLGLQNVEQLDSEKVV
jgi:hypothetical protein